MFDKILTVLLLGVVVAIVYGYCFSLDFIIK